ncbi:MAG: PP2C family protein-serine/threonine phosphatase [Leptonema sp. (in: bacteria)]
MKICFYTNLGLHRHVNEDALLVDGQLIANTDLVLPTYLEMPLEEIKLVVADGMGGHTKGDLASFLVLDYLRKQEIHSKKDLENNLQNAKMFLNEYVQEHPETLNLGAVVSGVIILKKQFLIFNVGDARVYQFENHILKRITKDHSVVEELYSLGYITYEQMRTHSKKHIVTSYISGDMQSKIPKIFITTLNKNENPYIFLICSDGLWEMLSDKEIQKSFLHYQNLQEIGKDLKQKAFAKGAYDNLSFIIVEV